MPDKPMHKSAGNPFLHFCPCSPFPYYTHSMLHTYVCKNLNFKFYKFIDTVCLFMSEFKTGSWKSTFTESCA